jgi:head-tail adaptor
MPVQGKYDLRVMILPRSLSAQGTNAEQVESWPATGAAYFAMRDGLSAGEIITQGIRQATGTMKLKIRGRHLSVSAADRVKVVATGEVYAITGLWREKDDTVLVCERAHQQTAGQ